MVPAAAEAATPAVARASLLGTAAADADAAAAAVAVIDDSPMQ